MRLLRLPPAAAYFANLFKIQHLTPGGRETRTLIWGHPSNPKPHVQLDIGKNDQPIYSQGMSDEKRPAGTSFDSGGRGVSDSPHEDLASLDQTVSVNDHFTYYIMFRPDTKDPRAAIWVPVARARWFWKATADQRDRKWSLRKAPKMEPAIEMATVDFPVYHSNADENEVREAAKTSSHEQFDELEDTGQELEETFASDEEEFADEWTTELPDYESGDVAQEYDTPLEHGLFEYDVAPWAAGVDPFPPAPTLAFQLNDPAMQAAFASLATSNVRHLCAALVDVTGKPVTPAYGGLNDEEMVFVGSLGKICTMYAAYALRAQVQAFVHAAALQGAPVVPPSITDELAKAWKPKLQALFPTRPGQSFGNKQDITFPQIEKVFTFLPDGTVDFARRTPAMTNEQLDKIGELNSPEGGFHDWMRLMTRWSNNAAAGNCTRALGYVYINGALARAGFFNSANKTGLWLSGDYAKHDWVTTQAERSANAAGQPLTARWAKAQGRRRSNMAGTAAQAARLLTLMALDKLVDANASKEMRTLLQAAIECLPDPSCGIGSYVKDALDGASPKRAFSALAAKKGYGDDSFSHEGAIVERTVGGKDLRYVVVGLGSARGRERLDLSRLFLRLDDAIVKRNP